MQRKHGVNNVQFFKTLSDGNNAAGIFSGAEDIGDDKSFCQIRMYTISIFVQKLEENVPDCASLLKTVNVCIG